MTSDRGEEEGVVCRPGRGQRQTERRTHEGDWLGHHWSRVASSHWPDTCEAWVAGVSRCGQAPISQPAGLEPRANQTCRARWAHGRQEF